MIEIVLIVLSVGINFMSFGDDTTAGHVVFYSVSHAVMTGEILSTLDIPNPPNTESAKTVFF